MQTTDHPLPRPRALDVIGLGGLVVAVLDIANAITFWAVYKGTPATRILQSVARGLLGKEAFAGGAWTAWLGAGLHTLIALGVAAVFYAGCRVWPALWRRPWVAGPVYGLVVFGVMHAVVLPLSRAAGGTETPPWLVADVLGHIVLIGLPLALIARWSARPIRSPSTKPMSP